MHIQIFSGRIHLQDQSQVIYISRLRSLGACVDLKVSKLIIKVILRYSNYEIILKAPTRFLKDFRLRRRSLSVWATERFMHGMTDLANRVVSQL